VHTGEEGSTLRLCETKTLLKIVSRGNHKNVQCSSPGSAPFTSGSGGVTKYRVLLLSFCSLQCDRFAVPTLLQLAKDCGGTLGNNEPLKVLAALAVELVPGHICDMSYLLYLVHDVRPVCLCPWTMTRDINGSKKSCSPFIMHTVSCLHQKSVLQVLPAHADYFPFLQSLQVLPANVGEVRAATLE